MYIIKSNRPKIESCGTPASTDDQFEHQPTNNKQYINIIFYDMQAPGLYTIQY